MSAADCKDENINIYKIAKRKSTEPLIRLGAKVNDYFFSIFRPSTTM